VDLAIEHRWYEAEKVFVVQHLADAGQRGSGATILEAVKGASGIVRQRRQLRDIGPAIVTIDAYDEHRRTIPADSLLHLLQRRVR
jgi:hypothetical protein